jgi:hypothetical protein
MKRFASICALLLFLTSCSSGRSAEQLQTLVDLAKTEGAMQEFIYDSSYGPQSTWCMDKSNQYISTVMGFDGSNGDDDMGEVSVAYFRACMGF